LKYLLVITFSVLLMLSCKKDAFITSPDATVFSSADTLFFDTVFTTAGSVIRSFKIFNNNNRKLRLSEIELSGGNASPFKINIDGISTTKLQNVDIDAGDSLYVFVQVNIDPASANLPFLVTDSIRLTYNGVSKYVQLNAWGQNAVFLKNTIINGNVTWNSRLPYVILGGLLVNKEAVLTISAGTKIFVHADAAILVDGTMIANGTKNDPIVFSGDRLDPDYKDLPAAWPGIFLRQHSKSNFFIHTVIQNAYQGIIVQGAATNNLPKLTLSRCIINNVYDAGIWAENTMVNADNCLISNCGKNILLSYGGEYRFVNCTVASFSNIYIQHTSPVLQISNFQVENSSLTTALNASFVNCIFWGEGNTEDEILVNKIGSDPFNVSFDHVLYKAKNDPANSNFIASIKNENPNFDSINIQKNIFDFHFRKNPASPTINAGISTNFPLDLDDKVRDATPDLGCYEL
jgi:hypothetical protein